MQGCRPIEMSATGVALGLVFYLASWANRHPPPKTSDPWVSCSCRSFPLLYSNHSRTDWSAKSMTSRSPSLPFSRPPGEGPLPLSLGPSHARLVLSLLRVLPPLLHDLTLLEDRASFTITFLVTSGASHRSGFAGCSPSVNTCETEQNCLQKTLSGPTVSLSENLIKISPGASSPPGDHAVVPNWGSQSNLRPSPSLEPTPFLCGSHHPQVTAWA